MRPTESAGSTYQGWLVIVAGQAHSIVGGSAWETTPWRARMDVASGWRRRRTRSRG